LLLPFFHNKFIEAGVDEVGRGCYAGPVYAAAVILPKDFYHPLLNDSKALTKDERNYLKPIIEKESYSFAIASVTNEEIDRINILQASFKAMHLAIQQLTSSPYGVPEFHSPYFYSSNTFHISSEDFPYTHPCMFWPIRLPPLSKHKCHHLL
jgi:hypothetical protein